MLFVVLVTDRRRVLCSAAFSQATAPHPEYFGLILIFYFYVLSSQVPYKRSAALLYEFRIFYLCYKLSSLL